MFFWGNTEKYSVVLDVNSGSVGAAIIKLAPKGKPQIMETFRVNLPFQPMVSADKYLKGVKSTINTVINQIQKSPILHGSFAKHSPSRILRLYIILSSPWYISQTNTIKVTKNRPFTITKSFIEELQKKEGSVLLTKNSDSNFNNGHVVENHVVQVKVRGYVVEDYLKKSTKEVEISLYTAAVSEMFIQDVRHMIESHLATYRTTFHTSPLAVTSIIKDLYQHDANFMYLDLGGELADIYIVKNDLLVENVSLPIGRNHFIRNIATTLKVSPVLAESMLKLHLLGQSDKNQSDQVQVVINQTLVDWDRQFNQLFSPIEDSLSLPSLIYASPDDLYVSMITNHISTSAKDNKYEIIKVSRSRLASLRIFTAHKTPDYVLDMFTVFLNKLKQE